MERTFFLIGLEAFIPPDSQVAAGHRMFDLGRGRLEGDAWYLIRSPDGNYDLRRIPRSPRPSHGVDAIDRRLALSTDRDAIYFGGFDANKTPAHNTAWIVRATLARRLAARISCAAPTIATREALAKNVISWMIERFKRGSSAPTHCSLPALASARKT